MNPCSGSDIAIHKHVILAKSKMESSSIPCRSAVNMNKKMDNPTDIGYEIIPQSGHFLYSVFKKGICGQSIAKIKPNNDKKNASIVVFIIGKKRRDIANMWPTPLMSLVFVLVKLLICFLCF